MKIIVTKDCGQLVYYLDDGAGNPKFLGLFPNLEDPSASESVVPIPGLLPFASSLKRCFESGLKNMAKALGHAELEIKYEE